MENTKQFDFSIFKEDKTIVEQYVRSNKSEFAYHVLKLAYSVLKVQDSIVNIDFKNIYDYFNVVNDKNAQINHKDRFFTHLIRLLQRLKVLKFRGDIDKKIIIEDLKDALDLERENWKNGCTRTKQPIYLTPKEIEAYRDFYREDNSEIGLRNYVMVSIFIISGCTAEGLSNLVIKNINFEKSRFETLDKPRDSKDWAIYHFPEPFAEILKYYIERTKKKIDDKLIDIKKCTMRQVLRKYARAKNILDKESDFIQITPHKLRALFNQFTEKEGCKPEIMCKFLNQKIESVNSKHYLPFLKKPEYVRIAYHYFFPYKNLYPHYRWEQWRPKWEELEKMLKELKPIQ